MLGILCGEPQLVKNSSKEFPEKIGDPEILWSISSGIPAEIPSEIRKTPIRMPRAVTRSFLQELMKKL